MSGSAGMDVGKHLAGHLDKTGDIGRLDQVGFGAQLHAGMFKKGSA